MSGQHSKAGIRSPILLRGVASLLQLKMALNGIVINVLCKTSAPLCIRNGVSNMITYEVVYPNGNKKWYLNGYLHRVDGPAIEYAIGSKEWYLNDKLHREDGPAIEYANGTKYWYLDGKRHREDGPAVELADGDKFWYLRGERLTESEFNEQMNPVKE